jgi:hypothetical protein
LTFAYCDWVSGGAAPRPDLSRIYLGLFILDIQRKLCDNVRMSERKNWTKEQWRDWGKRKKERDELRERENIGKQEFGAWVIERYWHEYREKNCN